ncbi:SCO family protein [Comamonas sp. 4034]|uniref:SCO family protein n=1 Tax=Comamonas sp. 4034 TaxID=3156455 RepID=UPI003D19B972
MSGSKLSKVSAGAAATQAPPPADEELLGLTVHSLPAAQAGDAIDAAERSRSGRIKMFLVLLVCAAPVIASYFTYYVIRPEGRRNFGELVVQQPTLPAMQVQTLDGKAFDLQSLKGQWLLVSASPAACDDICQNNLYLQRQLRESMGREKERVDWVWLITDGGTPAETMRPALSQATVLRMPQAAVAQWLAPASGAQLADHLYVVDPLGHWMMRFPARLSQSDAAKARKDLERLLRASSSWDKEGR